MNIKTLKKLEGILVHYTGRSVYYIRDEWIFEPKKTICCCRTVCTANHRLAVANTQSKGVEGSVSFINSIIQCLSNIPQFRMYYASKMHVKKSELARRIATLLNDIWSGGYKVIATDSLMTISSELNNRFCSWRPIDPKQRLSNIFKAMHEDLNLVHLRKPDFFISRNEPDQILDDLPWNVYVKYNKSKIVDLFQAQQKINVICTKCNENEVIFDIYTYLLSVPIIGSHEKSFIVDVFHRKTDHSINKPIRHVFHVNKNEKIRDLAKCVADRYGTEKTFVLFYKNWKLKVAGKYDDNLTLGLVPNREALVCYILKDWNEEITPKEIKERKLSLQLAKICHSKPFVNLSKKKLFGMPFVISFLNIHSRRQLHQIIYQRLYDWVGHDTLIQPPKIKKLIKVLKEKKNEKYEDDYEYFRPSQQAMDEYESAWNAILNLMPYTLHSFSWRSNTTKTIPIDDEIFMETIDFKDNQDIDIAIEWETNAYNQIKSVLNTVIADPEYSAWKRKKAMKANNGGDKVSLYECIDLYVDQQTINCSKCKENENKNANRKIDLWSFPEILIIHLERFQSFITDEGGKWFRKTSEFVECPIYGLDLSKYVINKNCGIKPIYDLCSVICHDGTFYNGGYSACALNTEINRWYCFNESSVKTTKQSDIISPSTYILFYKKRH